MELILWYYEELSGIRQRKQQCPVCKSWQWGEFPWGQEVGYKTPLIGSMIYLPLESTPISTAALSRSPTRFPNKIVAGSSNISSTGDWLIAF